MKTRHVGNPDLFDFPAPPLASVIRKHFTSERARTGRPEDLANDIDCDRSSVYAKAKDRDTNAREIRALMLALAKDHADLARDVFDALGFRDAGYAIVTQAELTRMQQLRAQMEALLARAPAPKEAGEGA